jgi:O-antigen ligase
MSVTLLYIWYKSKRKIIGMFLLIVASGVVFGAGAFVSSGHNYWEIMNTIVTEGSSGGTGADRKTLWGWAWRVFLENPIIGAGTGNAGVKFVDLIPEDEMLNHGYTKGKLWGRAIHCVPLTILADYGLIGAFVFAMLIVDFLRTNSRTRRGLNIIRGSSLYGPKTQRGDNSTMPRRYLYINSAISACFVAYWINAVFYETLYAAFLWNLVTMNRLLFVNVRTMREEQKALDDSYNPSGQVEA